MRILKHSLFIALAALCVGPRAVCDPEVLAGWNVSTQTGYGTSPLAATTTSSNVTVGGLTRGSGVTTTGTAAGRAWGGNGWDGAANATDAVTANNFATFTVTANSGQTVSFSSISKFDYRRSSTGPTTGELQYQFGSGAFTPITTLNYSSTSSSGASLSAIPLSGIPALQNVPAGTTVTFRIVNYGASSSSGTWYVFDTANSAANDLVIEGTTGGSSTFSVTYNGNGHTGGTAPVDSTAYASGANVAVQGAGTLTKTDCTFVHWNTAANGSGTSYSAGSTFAIGANTTLYAQWYSSPTISATRTGTYRNTTVTLSATVTPGTGPASTGLAVTGDLTAIGGSASQTFTAGANNTFTYTATISSGQPYGTYTIPLTVTDAQGRSGTADLYLSVASSIATDFTLLHVNDVHSRLQPHDYDVPGIDDVPVFQQVGGAAHMAAKLMELKTAHPNSLVLDAGDISEGGPLGDIGGNRGLIDVYKKIDERLRSLGGRGFDALVVGNHDVRFPEMLTNMKNSGLPFISMNLIDLSTGTSYLPEHQIVLLDGVRVGILGYTTDTSSHLGPDTVNQVRVDKCTWDGGSGVISIKQKVAALRGAPHNCDVVVLLAHIGHSRIFSGPDQLVKDNDPAVPPPEVAITGHWHSMTGTVWQPSIVNYQTTLSEAASYMQYVGELTLSPTGGYLGSAKHLVDATPAPDHTITPDAEVQTVVNNLIAEFNAGSPPYQLEQIIGYSATDLRLNKNKWWTHNEFPWAGDNAAGAWIADSMRWWVDSQPLYQCDLALQSGGGVRRDNAAGPITYREIYETYPWRDDNMILMEVKGQEIWNFIQDDFVGTSISQGWKIHANDGIIWKIEKDGVPIDPNATFSVAVSTYMYDHANDFVPGGWSDTTPTVVTVDGSPGGSPYSIRQTVIDYTSQFNTPENPMVVPGGRYELDTTMAGRFEAVVTMIDDVEDQPYFEAVFVRLLSATPDTVARRGGYAPAELVNADGTINPAHQFSESMLYRSYLGFPDGVLQPGDKLLVAVEGGFHAGNPQLVEQEGIVSDGVEFNRTGTDLAAAAPVYHGAISSFWEEWHENHFVKFQAEKVSNSRVKDREGFEITVYQPGGYNIKEDLPGSVGDLIELTGVQTYRYSERRFRCASAAVVQTGGGGALDYAPCSSVGAISPAVVYGPGGSLLLTATASDATQQTFSSLTATEDATIAEGKPTSASNGQSLYVQSAAAGVDPSGYGNERSLVKFNLAALPSGVTITAADLRLWCWSQTASENILADAHSMTGDGWAEATATWSTAASLLGSKLSSATLFPTNDQWYEWNVTSYVQSQHGADNVVSLMVKPAAEDSATLSKYVFDSSEYTTPSLHPVLEVHYTGAPDTGGTVANVAFHYRYSSDGSTWGPWTLAGTDTDGAPWQMSFNYPAGYGHYQFYSVATDDTAKVEPAPLLADASVSYERAPATVELGGLSQVFTGQPRVATVTTVPSGLGYAVTYDASSTAPIDAGSYAVLATITHPDYVGSASGTLVVDKASQTITFDPIPNMTVGDPEFGLSAAATSGLEVTYSGNNPAVATVSSDGLVNIVGAGTVTITASQGGDANHLPATSVNQTLTVQPLPPRIPATPPWALAVALLAFIGAAAWALRRRTASRVT